MTDHAVLPPLFRVGETWRTFTGSVWRVVDVRGPRVQLEGGKWGESHWHNEDDLVDVLTTRLGPDEEERP